MKLLQTKTLQHYASGSAMVFMNDLLWLAGDNMGYLLVLDTEFREVSRVDILGTGDDPIPKATKPDIEAATAISASELLLIGSGSLAPYRNNAWIINTTSGQKTTIDLQPFYDRLKTMGLHDLNIEGAATLPGSIVLSNRGNKTNPENHLIFTTPSFWKEQSTAAIDIKKLQEVPAFSGISGMEYSSLSDTLLLTLSTEDTPDSYTDGAIGKSYLCIVNNISGKSTAGIITPDRIIDLEAADCRFKGQKIETVCILHETNTEMELALAADNDSGNTVLFKALLKK